MGRYRPHLHEPKAQGRKCLDHPAIFVEPGRHAQRIGKAQAAHLGRQPRIRKGKETRKQTATQRGRTNPLAQREGLLVDALWIAAEQEGAGEALVCAHYIAILHRSRPDSRPVSGHGVTFFRGMTPYKQKRPGRRKAGVV